MKKFLLQSILLCCFTIQVCSISHSMEVEKFPIIGEKQTNSNYKKEDLQIITGNISTTSKCYQQSKINRIINLEDLNEYLPTYTLKRQPNPLQNKEKEIIEDMSTTCDNETSKFYEQYKDKIILNKNNIAEHFLKKLSMKYSKYQKELCDELFFQAYQSIFKNILYPTAIQKIQNFPQNKDHILIGYLPIDYWKNMITNNHELKQLVDKDKKSFFIDFINNNSTLYILYCHDQHNEKYRNMNIDVYAITNEIINKSTDNSKNIYKDLYLKLLKYKLNTTYNGSKLQSNINDQYHNIPINEQLKKVIETGINVFGENTIIEILYSLLNDNQYSTELSNFWYSNQLSSEFIAKFMNHCLQNYGKEHTWEILFRHLSCLHESLQEKERIKLCSIFAEDIKNYFTDNMYLDNKSTTIYRYGPGVPNQYNISIICNSNDNNHNIIDLYIPISDGIISNRKMRNIASHKLFLKNEFSSKYLSDDNITQWNTIQYDVMNNYFNTYGPKCVYNYVILPTIEKLNNNNIINDNMNLFEITEDNLQALINSGAIENTNHIIKFNNNKEQIPVLNFTKAENNNYLVSVKFINDKQINEDTNGIIYRFQDIFLNNLLKKNIESIIKNKDITLDNNTFYNNLTKLSVPLKYETKDKNEININKDETNNKILLNNADRNESNINVNNKILLNNKIILIKKNENQLYNISLNFKNISQEDKNNIMKDITVQIINELANITNEDTIRSYIKKLYNILKSNDTILNRIKHKDLVNIINNVFNNGLKTNNADSIGIINNITDIIQMLHEHWNIENGIHNSNYQEIITVYIDNLLNNNNIKLKKINNKYKSKILNNIHNYTSEENIQKLKHKMGLK